MPQVRVALLLVGSWLPRHAGSPSILSTPKLGSGLVPAQWNGSTSPHVAGHASLRSSGSMGSECAGTKHRSGEERASLAESGVMNAKA